MSWLKKIVSQLNYSSIGHGENVDRLIGNGVVLWVHSGKQLYSEKISQEFTEHYDFGDLFYTSKATGRVDSSKKIGSCEFRTLDKDVKKTIIFDLISEFPGVNFLVFKNDYDADNYPNPENIQSYYQKLKENDELV